MSTWYILGLCVLWVALIAGALFCDLKISQLKYLTPYIRRRRQRRWVLALVAVIAAWVIVSFLLYTQFLGEYHEPPQY